MQVLETVDQMRAFAARSAPIAFVPTMGFLHAGHTQLMQAARVHAPVVVASIFVNPTQFGPNEDFDRYPRDRDGDLQKCAAAGCDAVFLPPVEAIYPPGHRTKVSVTGLTGPLCGASRPGHFDGVTTVVLKLLNIVGCRVAVFGEKDFQQLAVIRRMCRDLDVPVDVVGHPIVREPDGLALSSRNVYLSPEDRMGALALSRGLAAAHEAFDAGERDPRRLEAIATALLEATPNARIDYVEVRDADDLEVVSAPVQRPVVLALAVKFGATRLIDNRVFDPR
jgi:pantoate--beta-alanine ligase